WIRANAPPVYVSSIASGSLDKPPSKLYRVVPTSDGLDYLVGTIETVDGYQPAITDVERTPDGRLYGASYTTLYSINSSTAQAVAIGDFGFSNINALAADVLGNLFAATTSGDFVRVNATTGRGTLIGKYGSN